MEFEEEFINILFKVVRQCNKTQYDSYNVKDAPVFESVKELRVFLYEKFKTELEPATCPESFRLGYITGTKLVLVLAAARNLQRLILLQKEDSSHFGLTQTFRRSQVYQQLPRKEKILHHWNVKTMKVSMCSLFHFLNSASVRV